MHESISEVWVTYGEVRFTIKGGLHSFLNTISCGLQLRAAYNGIIKVLMKYALIW